MEIENWKLKIFMQKYFKIFWRVARMSWMVSASYKVDLIIRYITSIVYLVTHFGVIYFLFYVSIGEKMIAGFGQFEFYFVFCLTEILWFICFGIFFINSKNLIDRIIDGTLDYFLIRPVNRFFLVACSQFDVDQVVTAVWFGFLSCVLAFYFGRWEWLINNWWIVAILIGLAVILLFFIIWVASLVNFFWPKFWVLRQMTVNLSDISNFPRRVYPGWMQQIFLWLFPMLLMVSPIYDLLANGLDNWFWLNALLVLVAWLLIFLMLWREGIKKYCSAG